MGNALAHKVTGSRAAVIGLLLILIGTSLSQAQTVTIRGKGLSIFDIIREITRQTGYSVIYSAASFENEPTLDLDIREMNLKQLMDSCFAGKEINYSNNSRIIVVYSRILPESTIFRPLVGSVTGEDGEPLQAASLSIDGVPVGMTKADGSFRLPVNKPTVTLSISYAGYSSQTISCSNRYPLTIMLKHYYENTAEVAVYSYSSMHARSMVGTAYTGYTSGRWDSIRPLLGNPPTALTAKVPGLTVRQYNGVPGSAYEMLLRGRHSISHSTDPLVVVDGIPLTFNDGGLGRIGSGSAQGQAGASPLNGIPLSAVEKIEILKDPNAMAAFGFQSSNGVILVTLRKGLAGPARWSAEVSSGVDQVIPVSPLMNTRQYLKIRKEAIQNDGLPVNPATLPEYFLWDTSRNSDFKKMVIGNTRLLTQAIIGVSGGDTCTTYRIEGNMNRQSSLFPGPTGDAILSFYGDLHHETAGKRLRLDGSLLWSDENNRLPIQDNSYAMYLAPNAPSFTDATGAAVWSSKGLSFPNIPALQRNDYRAGVSSLLSNLQLSYKLLQGLEIRGGLGYYNRESHESSQQLFSRQAPAINAVGSRYSAGKTSRNLQTTAEVNYSRTLGPGRLSLFSGFSWQHQQVNYNSVAAIGYADDQLLAIDGGNPVITSDRGKLGYEYSSLFNSINYDLRNQYVFSVSGRRDVSSRPETGNRAANFWTAGMAWFFDKQEVFRRCEWLNLGKLLVNIGTSGNDLADNGIPGPQWLSTGNPGVYKGLQNAYPAAFANPRVGWEVNYNMDLGLDLSILKNRIQFSTIAYRDWTANLPVTIVNKGLEFSLQTRNISRANFRWLSTLTLTIPANRLTRLSQPAAWPYDGTLVVGKSLTVVNGYHYTGVNPTTGLFRFQDLNGDGQLNERDKVAGGNLDTRLYGGLDQYLSLNNWSLNLFLDFRIQNGVNPYAILYRNNPPGSIGDRMLGNGPVEWLNHWQRPGDKAPLQRLTTTANPQAAGAIGNYLNSDALVTDASFVRVKALTLTYRLSERTLSQWHLHDASISLRGQNLLTFTHYPVTDPETQNPFVLPPVRTIVMGLRVGF